MPTMVPSYAPSSALNWSYPDNNREFLNRNVVMTRARSEGSGEHSGATPRCLFNDYARVEPVRRSDSAGFFDTFPSSTGKLSGSICFGHVPFGWGCPRRNADTWQSQWSISAAQVLLWHTQLRCIIPPDFLTLGANKFAESLPCRFWPVKHPSSRRVLWVRRWLALV